MFGSFGSRIVTDLPFRWVTRLAARILCVMNRTAKRRALAIFVTAVALTGLAVPAYAVQKLGAIGSVTAGVPVLSPTTTACPTTLPCMSASATFKPTGTANTVYITISLYRTANKSGTTIGSTDVLLATWTSAGQVIAKGSTKVITYTPAAPGYKCKTVVPASTTYGYYTKVFASNASSVSALDPSAIKQLKGCLT